MLIVYSGGMDSTVLLNEYKDKIKLAVSFNYGSKHNKKELYFAKKNCEKMNIKHLIIDLDFMNKYFKSNLLQSGEEVPDGHYEDAVMKKTVVPFRNGIMLSVATGIAESNNLNKILIANHAGDHAIYPDCRATFIQAINEAAAYGTYNNVNILSPYNNLTKREIALMGKDLGVNFNDTWSCYKGEEIHCGTCGTCVERKEAFEIAGVKDPTIYV